LGYNYLDNLVSPSPSGGNVTSVDSTDNCILVNPTTGDVLLTFNTSCASIGGSSFNSTYDATSRDVTANRTAWFSTFNSTYASYGVDGVLIKYQNITNIPTCSGTDVLSFDGTTLSCVAQTGSGG